MVYYLRPVSKQTMKSSPYRFYKSSPNPNTGNEVSSQSSESSQLESSPESSEKNMMNMLVPYLVISIVVSAVVLLVVMTGLKPRKGCCEFLTQKNDKGEVKMSHVKVVLFSLLVGSVVGLLCFAIHYSNPSLLDM
jgi:hypothetical protein